MELDGLLDLGWYVPAIDPLRLAALGEFQQYYTPSIEDDKSFMARVVRTATPEIVRPEALAAVEKQVSNPGTRAALLALGPRTSLIVPLLDAKRPTQANAVLLTAMSSSGRLVDEDDLDMLAHFARELSARIRW